jgi:hypothetical protein
MRKAKIFDKLLDKLEPFLVIEDLNDLKVYHPSVLSKRASLAIFQSQQKVDYINDEIEKLTNDLEKLRNLDNLSDENYAQRDSLGKQIYTKRDEADSEIFEYIAQLSKSDSKSTKKLFSDAIKSHGIDLDVSQFAQEVFSLIAEELMEYKAEEIEKLEKEEKK